MARSYSLVGFVFPGARKWISAELLQSGKAAGQLLAFERRRVFCGVGNG
jgi:hypothetical protein